MRHKGKPAKAPQDRSRKGAANLDAKKKIAAEAQKGLQRKRQHEMERSDRGGPQGQKDKDFQRKF